MEKPTSLPAFVQRGVAGQFHTALNVLEGRFSVDKRIFIAGGTPDKPTESSKMISRREWIGATAKHLKDTTEGIQGGSPYYRLGVLGYSNVDRWYEWATFDGLNANSMSYRSGTIEAPTDRIELKGVFTDQGLLGEAAAGTQVAMRTLIHLKAPDSHVIELFFVGPDGKEVLADRSVYTRL